MSNGSTTLVLTPFNVSPSDLTDVLSAQLKAGGFNTITGGFFTNPAIDKAPDFPSWKAGFDGWFAALAAPLVKYGFKWLCTGDDLCRSPTELVGSTSGYGPQAVSYATQKLVNTGLCVGIEMVDEANLLWKNGPDPGMYGIVDNMRSVPNCPPISWPLHTQKQNTTPTLAPWCDPTLCDYISVYSPAQIWFPADLPGQQYSVPKEVSALQNGLALVPGPARSTLIPWSGDYGTGATIQVGAWRPQVIQSALWLALAQGITTLRLYGWDVPAWAAGRINPSPTQTWATGTTPTVGADRWFTSSTSLNLMSALSRQILGPPMTTSAWPVGWATVARPGVFWAINTTESPLTVPNIVPPLPHACLLDPVSGRIDVSTISVPNISVTGGGVLVMWGT